MSHSLPHMTGDTLRKALESLMKSKGDFEIVEPLNEFISNFTFLRQRGIHVYIVQSDFKK